MIDLHCHLLPGIDDGPGRAEGSIAMAKAALRDGTQAIVATPHVSWNYRNTPDGIAGAVADLEFELLHAGVALEIHRGAEIDASYSMELSDDDLRALRLGDSDALLVECPLTVSPSPMDAIVFALHKRGYRIVLAHPERSPMMRAQPGRLEALVRTGALTQITTGSLLGQFGREVQRFSYWMLEEGLVHNVATDAHDLHRRPPHLRDALRTAAVVELPALAFHADWLALEVPRAILAGAPLPPPPLTPLRAPRGPLRRLSDRIVRRA